jgi:hypothetical protein
MPLIASCASGAASSFGGLRTFGPAITPTVEYLVVAGGGGGGYDGGGGGGAGGYQQLYFRVSRNKQELHTLTVTSWCWWNWSNIKF